MLAQYVRYRTLAKLEAYLFQDCLYLNEKVILGSKGEVDRE